MEPKKISLIALPLLPILLAGVLVLASGETVKQPSVAGSFYAGDPKILAETVDHFLSRVESVETPGKLIALIVPHAGYQFSGQTAAYSYDKLKGRAIDTVILIGPSHYSTFSGVSVYANGRMRTPLGDVTINSRMARSLLSEKAQVVFDAAPYGKEHSLEVQLPFLQRVLGDFKVVPVLIGRPTRASFDHLVRTITLAVRGNPNTIIVASTDLSHYHDYATAQGMDKKVIDATTRMSQEDLRTAVDDRAR